MKKLNNIVKPIFITASALAFIVLAGCTQKHHKEEKTKFLITKPWRRSLDITNDYVAQIHAIQHIEIRAFERGYLQEIFVDEGQSVEKGAKMFQLMPMIMKAEYEKSKAEYDLTKIEYKNTRNLARKKVVSGNEFALAKAKLGKAKADLDLAKIHLDLTTIKAPFNGIMDRFHARLGSLVEEGELLSTLSDNSKMWVYFNVSEANYLNYMKLNKDNSKVDVRLKLANGDIFDQVGKIDTIEADFSNETGNVAFRATFPNPNKLLRHGETGNILLTEPLENALVIPQKATFEILDKKFVYVVDKDNRLKSRQITVAQEVPHLFVIESGIDVEDRILLEGLGMVEPGEEIEPEYQEPHKVMASLDLPLS